MQTTSFLSRCELFRTFGIGNIAFAMKKYLAILFCCLTAASCSGDINLEDKQVETISVTDITKDSAILTGYVATGEFWGFILSSSKDFLNTGMPIYVDDKDENQLYRVRVTGLDPGTTYYVTAAILQDPKTELGDMAFGRTLPFKTKKR